MIKVAIIDDNIEFTEILQEYLSTLENIDVVGVEHNGLNGMKLISDENPDLVILDLIMPYSDGLSLLKNLYTDYKGLKVLILTSLGSEDIIIRARELGASYFLMKPVELSVLSDTINSIFPEESLSTNKQKEKKEQLNKKIDDLEMKVTDILRSLGITANLKGYFFLREAIQMAGAEDILLGGNWGLTTEIYPAIAEQHHTTVSRVERAIRHAIEVGWNRGNRDVLETIFGHSVSEWKSKPSNGKFIALISDYLRLKQYAGSTRV
ncbi:sporulation transcription factor Spo0A [Neobacillus dielmonensis]|uniref:sporulation transcription factor Spo0A n=1 Tax=Neobacillus dielmonensis TaxID=1347369 RepID=UPI0005A9183F|nr:sporulation transcription factor Spo0A [Neobacillus dielmonensis]